VIHGYDYPVPDGRGFLGGWGPFQALGSSLAFVARATRQ
jgi:hypothetical protein